MLFGGLTYDERQISLYTNCLFCGKMCPSKMFCFVFFLQRNIDHSKFSRALYQKYPIGLFCYVCMLNLRLSLFSSSRANPIFRAVITNNSADVNSLLLELFRLFMRCYLVPKMGYVLKKQQN